MNRYLFLNLILLLLLVQISSSFKRIANSPIHWINKTFNVNFDTTTNTRKYAFSSNNYLNNQVHFEFENKGSHVLFIDGSEDYMIQSRQCITKPGERNCVSYNKASLPFYGKKWTRKDTINKLLIPFYYEGETFMEEVEIQFTFGRSKLISVDQLEFDLTDSISKLVALYKTQDKRLSLRFKYEITIKNKTTTTILCSERFVAWNDAQYLNDYGKMIPIKPRETYKLPVELNMDQKYRFKCNGYIQVKSNTISEQHFCEFVSKYI